MTDEKMFKTDLANRVFDELSTTLGEAIQKGEISIYDRLFKIFELATHTEVALLALMPKHEDPAKAPESPGRVIPCPDCGDCFVFSERLPDGTLESRCVRCKGVRSIADTDTKKEQWPIPCWNQECAVCGEMLDKCSLYKDGTVEGWCSNCNQTQEGKG